MPEERKRKADTEIKPNQKELLKKTATIPKILIEKDFQRAMKIKKTDSVAIKM